MSYYHYCYEALNVGRKKFDGDLEFGQWVAERQLAGAGDKQRTAAMWAAENTDLMYEIMEDNPRIKTVRGAHAKHTDQVHQKLTNYKLVVTCTSVITPSTIGVCRSFLI